MYTNYNIPQYSRNMQNYHPQNYSTANVNHNDGDRLFFGGGFAAPFLLGGIAGSLLSRPNYPIYAPGPPIYYPPRPYPYYSSTYNYY